MTNEIQHQGYVKSDTFQSFSLKLNDFLENVKGLKPIGEGVHKTGLLLSVDGGATWEDFSNLFLAKNAHEDELKYFSVKEMRDAIAESQNCWRVSLSKRVKIKKRLRNYLVFEQTPELQEALDEWRATGPKAKKLDLKD